jgi:hypothetical protein
MPLENFNINVKNIVIYAFYLNFIKVYYFLEAGWDLSWDFAYLLIQDLLILDIRLLG